MLFSSEMNVEMTGPHEKRDKKQIEHEAYSSVKVRETDSYETDDRSNNSSLLGKSHDMPV